jgi:hypothetical protein
MKIQLLIGALLAQRLLLSPTIATVADDSIDADIKAIFDKYTTIESDKKETASR